MASLLTFEAVVPVNRVPSIVAGPIAVPIGADNRSAVPVLFAPPHQDPGRTAKYRPTWGAQVKLPLLDAQSSGRSAIRPA